jgi:hypothetical protein
MDSVRDCFTKTLKLDSGFYPFADKFLASQAYFNYSEDALGLIDKAVEQDSTNWETLILSLRIKHYFKSDDIIMESNRIVNLRPIDFQPYYIRGQYYFHTAKEPEQAYEDFRGALKYVSEKDLKNFDSFYLTYYQIFELTERFSKMNKLRGRNRITEDQLSKMEKYKHKFFEFNK